MNQALLARHPRLQSGFTLWFSALLLVGLFSILCLRGVTNACLALMLVSSVAWLLIARPHLPPRQWRWALLGFVAWPLLVALQVGTMPGVQPRAFDAQLRFLGSIPVAFALASLPGVNARVLRIGSSLGAIAALTAGLLFMHQTGEPRAANPFTNAIPYGDIALLLGVLPLYGISRWRQPSRVDVLAMIGALAGLAASVLSASRGGWVAVPLFAVLLRMPWRAWMSLLLLILLTGFLLAQFDPMFASRFQAASSDLQLLAHGNRDTSIGLRTQLWQSALHVFSQHPWLGVGKGLLKPTLETLAQQGVISPLASSFSHAHNEVISSLAETGLIGAVFLLCLYVCPALLFWRYRNSPLPQVAGIARMGLALAGGFFIFGWTEVLFIVAMTTSFYAMVMVTLLGMLAAELRRHNVYPPA
ncbi:O-antigen ligase family protein [Amantichitinum ursilacus]|uniref:O-Antigen ligase n=1 Tax=Amantichitinum ursilacus TaxID=857265 RepID=A0A0N0XMF7_9NEIS|nr:O-antigen ligase family protein [Amantichitinum ursilacus]KPC55062.1 O-Antigen ligase [Amantichitinum ursilacus]